MTIRKPTGILDDIESTDTVVFPRDCVFKYIHYNKDGESIPETYMSEYVTEYNLNRQTPLMYSIVIGNINYVKQLLLYDIGKIDDFGRCALDYAYKYGNQHIIDLVSEYELSTFWNVECSTQQK